MKNRFLQSTNPYEGYSTTLTLQLTQISPDTYRFNVTKITFVGRQLVDVPLPDSEPWYIIQRFKALPEDKDQRYTKSSQELNYTYSWNSVLFDSVEDSSGLALSRNFKLTTRYGGAPFQPFPPSVRSLTRISGKNEVILSGSQFVFNETAQEVIFIAYSPLGNPITARDDSIFNMTITVAPR